MELLKKVDSLYKRHGSGDYIGEQISQREHIVQAALLAESFFKNNACCQDLMNETILAALYHDVGNMLEFEYPGEYDIAENLGILNHEIHGGEWLANNGAPKEICELVVGHVSTKRYLISKNPDYFNQLSNASKKTYEHQGGEMTIEEIYNYENNSLFKLHLRIREWDDKAKNTDKKLLEFIKNLDITDYFAKYTY